MRRTVGGAAALLAAALSFAPAPAHADDAQELRGATFPADEGLAYVPCATFYAEATPPQARLNLGPDSPPLGSRSLGLVPSAAGSAAGPVARFMSIASGVSSMSVHAPAGTTGVSYAWYSAPDSAPGEAWSGRAEVSVPAAAWSTVDTAALTYEWTRVDLATTSPVATGGSASIAAFSAAHGDGPGFLVTGFGCDGREFNIDAVRAGEPGSVTTYDIEALDVVTTMRSTSTQTARGTEVELTGTVTDGFGRLLGDPLVLEARRPGGDWAAVGGPVLAGADATTRTTVRVSETTEFRWHRPRGQYADEGWSTPVLITVTGG